MILSGRIVSLDANVPKKDELLPEDHVVLMDVRDTQKKVSLLSEMHVTLLDTVDIPNDFETKHFAKYYQATVETLGDPYYKRVTLRCIPEYRDFNRDSQLMKPTVEITGDEQHIISKCPNGYT